MEIQLLRSIDIRITCLFLYFKTKKENAKEETQLKKRGRKKKTDDGGR
jgi:hypothetical protein